MYFSFRGLFLLLLGRSGGGGGNSTLGGPCGLTPVFGTGDFSNSSTPPYQELGAPPRNRTARTGVAIRPLADRVAAHGTLGVIRTPKRGFGIRLPHHRQPGQTGTLGRIRTGTVWLLRPLSLPVGLQAHGRLGRIRTDTAHGLSVLPLPSGLRACLYSKLVFGARFELATMRFSTARVFQLRHPNIGGQSRIRTLAIPKEYRGYSPALSATQPTAQTRIVKDLAEGRRLERLCPEGPWLSGPVGYQLPEPSRYKLQNWI